MKKQITLDIHANDNGCLSVCPFYGKNAYTSPECDLFGILIAGRAKRCEAAERRAKNRRKRKT